MSKTMLLFLALTKILATVAFAGEPVFKQELTCVTQMYVLSEMDIVTSPALPGQKAETQIFIKKYVDHKEKKMGLYIMDLDSAWRAEAPDAAYNALITKQKNTFDLLINDSDILNLFHNASLMVNDPKGLIHYDIDPASNDERIFFGYKQRSSIPYRLTLNKVKDNAAFRSLLRDSIANGLDRLLANPDRDRYYGLMQAGKLTKQDESDLDTSFAACLKIQDSRIKKSIGELKKIFKRK